MLFQYLGDRGVDSGAGVGATISILAIVVSLATASPRSTPFPGAVLPVLGAAGLIATLRSLPASSFLSFAFSHPVPLYVGRISYSLYLWHWPILVLFRWTVGLETLGIQLVVLGLSLLLAAASYHWVETPPRRARFIRSLPQSDRWHWRPISGRRMGDRVRDMGAAADHFVLHGQQTPDRLGWKRHRSRCRPMPAAYIACIHWRGQRRSDHPQRMRPFG
ncbi:MAG: acyltransferase family protein [Rhodopila sp.]